jgi:hypothetical protein
MLVLPPHINHLRPLLKKKVVVVYAKLKYPKYQWPHRWWCITKQGWTLRCWKELSCCNLKWFLWSSIHTSVPGQSRVKASREGWVWKRNCRVVWGQEQQATSVFWSTFLQNLAAWYWRIFSTQESYISQGGTGSSNKHLWWENVCLQTLAQEVICTAVIGVFLFNCSVYQGQ